MEEMKDNVKVMVEVNRTVKGFSGAHMNNFVYPSEITNGPSLVK